MLANRIKIKLSYENKDITADLSPYLKSFDYSDVMDGEADDINIALEDREELWKSDWLPEKGAMVKIELVQMIDGSEQSLNVGQFELDEIECSGMPTEVKLKGTSVPSNTALRGQEKNKSWEKTDLKTIAQDVCKGAGMELLYDSQDNPKYERAEQTQQSDLVFLTKLCKDAGLALKIADMQICIFDEEKYEAQGPSFEIEKGKSLLKSYSIRSSFKEVYNACHVKFQDTSKKEKIEYTYKVENKSGKTLEVNEEVKTIAEAEKLAKKRLREKNKDEITVSLSLVGDLKYSAGLTFTLKSFGKFDGKYIITKASHSIGAGYNVSLDCRRCLDGY